MKRFISVLVAALLLSGTALFAQSTMTDQQVLEYVEQGVAEGKTQEDLLKELTLRGVNRAQANRVRRLYESRSRAQATSDAPATTALDRSHAVAGEVDVAVAAETAEEVNNAARNGAPEEVFGMDIFRNRRLNFAPSENLATPRDYRLGPGDEVIIDIFGASQTTIRSKISPEGSVNVDYLGPLYLSGMTVEGADAYLKKRLTSIYSGIEDGITDIRLTLGQLRTIQVNVLGEVTTPGTYTLSSFSTVFHALYVAGGVKQPGSLRDIEVVRGGKKIGRADIYEFLINGSTAGDIRLEEGDVILVPTYKVMVKADGSFKRDMLFEMQEGETLDDLLRYAGGFSGGANTASLTVIRQDGRSFEVRTVEADGYGNFALKDGDEVTAGDLQSRFENRISIMGAVYLPGTYELGEVQTVRQLVAKAGGLLPEAFLGRAVIHREHPDRTMETLSINLGDVLAGVAPDFVLRNNDALYVADGFALKDQGTMTITGLVAQPGTFPFADNTSIEDLIVMAGGLQDGASTARVDVTRRERDSDGLIATGEVARLYSFALKDGLWEDGVQGFVLEPYDEVTVHSSPSYAEPRYIRVTGEVNFAGSYSMTSREERLSDLVAKAGGITQYAYLKGARLIRQMNAAERLQLSELQQLSEEGNNLSTSRLSASSYQVAIDLDRALSHPGGEYDVVLREDDVLEIPVMNNVVRIRGAVMMPNALTYDPNMRAIDYIKACGGYGQRSAPRKGYIVSMNGTAKPLRRYATVEPGSEIFVPEKPKKDVDVKSDVVAYSSAAASLATMTVAIVTLLKK